MGKESKLITAAVGLTTFVLLGNISCSRKTEEKVKSPSEEPEGTELSAPIKQEEPKVSRSKVEKPPTSEAPRTDDEEEALDYEEPPAD